MELLLFQEINVNMTMKHVDWCDFIVIDHGKICLTVIALITLNINEVDYNM